MDSRKTLLEGKKRLDAEGDMMKSTKLKAGWERKWWRLDATFSQRPVSYGATASGAILVKAKGWRGTGKNC